MTVKKFLMLALIIATLLFTPSVSSAKDFWVFNYPDGKSLYIVYESVVYGQKAGFYAQFRVKRISESGKLIKTEKWEMNHDEGDWWYGIVDERRNMRVYDYEDATEVLQWLKKHRNEAHRTSEPWKLVLGD